jgi:hypothetical protein
MSDRPQKWWHAASIWAWIFTLAFVGLAVVPSIESFLRSPSRILDWYDPTLAVLTATGIALVWYTKFTMELKDQQRELVDLEKEGRKVTQEATLQTLLAELEWLEKWLNGRKHAEGPTLHHPLRKEAIDLVLADGGRINGASIKGRKEDLITQLVKLRISLHNLHDRNELLIQSRTGTLPSDIYNEYWEDVGEALGQIDMAKKALSPILPETSQVGKTPNGDLDLPPRVNDTAVEKALPSPRSPVTQESGVSGQHTTLSPAESRDSPASRLPQPHPVPRRR